MEEGKRLVFATSVVDSSVKFCRRYLDFFYNIKYLTFEYYMTFLGITLRSHALNQEDTTLIHDLITELNLVTEFDIFTKLREISMHQLKRAYPSWPCPVWDVHLFFLFRPVTPSIDKTKHQLMTWTYYRAWYICRLLQVSISYCKE